MQLPHSPSDPGRDSGHGTRKASQDSSPPSARQGSGPSLQRAVQWALALLLALFALGLMLAAVLAGVLLTLGMVVWSLLRGRKPSLGAFQTVYRRARAAPTSPWQRQAGQGSGNFSRAGEVVDIEARVVPSKPAAHASGPEH